MTLVSPSLLQVTNQVLIYDSRVYCHRFLLQFVCLCLRRVEYDGPVDTLDVAERFVKQVSGSLCTAVSIVVGFSVVDGGSMGLLHPLMPRSSSGFPACDKSWQS
jgi:hypothetical protein